MTSPLRLVLLALILLIAAPSVASAACESARASTARFLDNLQVDQDQPSVAIQCFDWSGGPAGKQERVKVARELKAILDGRGLYVDYTAIPDDPEYTDTTTGLPKVTLFASLPELFLVREGDRWLVSRATVSAVPDLLEATYTLPLHRVAQQLPAVFHAEVLGIETWRLLGLVILMALGLIVARLLEVASSAVLRNVVGRFFESWNEDFVNAIVRRGSWIVTAGIVAILLPNLGLPVRLNQFLYVVARMVASIAAVLIALSVVDLLADALDRRAGATATRMDDQLIPLVRRASKMVVIAVGTLFVLQNLSVDVSSLLGSLAIGGLAFSLAAKDTLANLFGSVTIFTDKPFQIGDWVVVDGVEGSVEEVGFRSTRIRTFHDSQVTLPNSTVANATIDNMGRRRYRRFKVMLGLTYDTTADQMEAFIAGVRASIEANEFTRKDSFEVAFNGMGAHSLDVLVYCFFATDAWSNELRGKQQLMLEWMRVAQDVGVEFAFPTQTLHLEGLGAPADAGAARTA